MHRRLIRVTLLLVLWAGIGEVASSAEDDSNKLLATPGAAPRLLAHWTFDDTDASVIAEASGDESLQIRAEIPHAPGVLGKALELAGAHQLQTLPISSSGSMPQIAFAAWVRPVDLSGFREIYRQECPERILFSFQNGGTILSLGLNIGGYIECDAPSIPRTWSTVPGTTPPLHSMDKSCVSTWTAGRLVIWSGRASLRPIHRRPPLSAPAVVWANISKAAWTTCASTPPHSTRTK